MSAPVVSARRRAAEIGTRAGLVLLVWRRFPEVFWIDVDRYWRSFHHLSINHLPYRNFLWEFPPLTAVPAATARALPLRTFGIAFAAVMVAAEYAALELLRRGWPDALRRIVAYWSVVGWPVAAVGYFRFDFLAVVAATAGIVAIVRGRTAVTATVVGFAAKLWPVVLLAPVLVERKLRSAVTTAVALAALVTCWFAFSPSGFHAFIRFRHGSGVQVESLVGVVPLLIGHRPQLVSGAWVVWPGQLKLHQH